MNFSCSLPAFAMMVALVHAQPAGPDPPAMKHASAPPSSYVLGPNDQITVWALELEDLSGKTYRIDGQGQVNMLLVGRVQAGGLTVGELEQQLAERLRKYQKRPQVTVSVTEYRSQPVSVIGAVSKPGVHNLQGPQTLISVLSVAGGLTSDAGPTARITRLLKWGRVPLPGAKDDPGGEVSVAEVNLKSLLEARAPSENIVVRPDDVISVPAAELVFVIGEVPKAGGFPIGDRGTSSVLQALSQAGGLTRSAAANKARIIRVVPGTMERADIPVDLRRIMAGKADDVALRSHDILFVPNSRTRSMAAKLIEAAVTAGTGVAIWRAGQ